MEKNEHSNKSNKRKPSKNFDKFKKKPREVALYVKNMDIMQKNVNIEIIKITLKKK